MIETILTKIGALVLAPIVFLSTFFVQPVQVPVIEDNVLGVALPSGTALFETSLASPITGSASSLTLVANSVRGGGSLSGYQCFTIDEGSAQAEFVCGTVSGTTVTSLERGLSPSDGITETAALQFSHRRGSSVKITDFPLIQRLKSQASGSGTYENVLTYAAGVTPVNSGDLADKEYVLSVITSTSTISYDKHVIQGTAGETVATGTIVYLKASDSRWYKADNDLTETYVNQTLGIAQGPGTSGSSISGGVLTYGLDSTQKSLTPGGFVFLSSTAGATSTATTSQVLGKAISATTMFFDQNLIDSNVYVPTTFSATTTFTGAVTGLMNRYVYSASTTYTKPSNLKYIFVQAWGAGGSGGSDNAAGDEAGGGGGGAYVEMRISSSSLSATTSVVIGTGGSAKSGDNQDGAAGGTTSFGSIVTAYGGGGGGADATDAGGGGGGGSLGVGSTGGNSGNNGGAGSPGAVLYGAGNASGLYSGGGGSGVSNVGNIGGSTVYGGGGGGGCGVTTSAAAGGTSQLGGSGGAGDTSGAGSATAGTAPGGGGGAKCGAAGSSGAGANGLLIITEYF